MAAVADLGTSPYKYVLAALVASSLTARRSTQRSKDSTLQNVETCIGLEMLAKEQERKRKAVFSLESPYSTTEWPAIDSATQEAVVDLLCRTLQPMSRYRDQMPRARRGARSTSGEQSAFPSAGSSSLEAPEIASFLTIGMNKTTMQLETFSGSNVPSATLGLERKRRQNAPALPKMNNAKPLLAVFVCKGDSQPSQLHAHLPLLCHIASTAREPVRLVALPKGSEARLAAALGIPQAGCIGLLDGAPDVQGLCDIIRESVPPVHANWLTDLGTHRPTKIKATMTVGGKVAKTKPTETRASASTGGT